MSHLSHSTLNSFVPPPGLGGRYCAEVSAYTSTVCTIRNTKLGPTRALRWTPPFSSGSTRLPSLTCSHSTSPAPVVLAVIDFPSAPSAGSHLVVGETQAQSPQHIEHSRLATSIGHRPQRAVHTPTLWSTEDVAFTSSIPAAPHSTPHAPLRAHRTDRACTDHRPHGSSRRASRLRLARGWHR